MSRKTDTRRRCRKRHVRVREQTDASRPEAFGRMDARRRTGSEADEIGRCKVNTQRRG